MNTETTDPTPEETPAAAEAAAAPVRDVTAAVGPHALFLVIATIGFAALAAVFLFLPRSTYSELEKRDLAQFPPIETFGDDPAAYTAAVSGWFSDSEPFRDDFMSLSMNFRNLVQMQLPMGDEEEAVTFRPATTAPADARADGIPGGADPNLEADNPLANENAKVANASIIIVGTGPNVRALMGFRAEPGATRPYVNLLNDLAEAMPSVQVYSMAVPLATEFYVPDKARSVTRPEKPCLDYIRNNVSSKVKFVDVYAALAPHVSEDIYLRTDHHWAPLGAFYAARELAHTAGVPFRELTDYDKHVIRGYVGSMYGYSKDIAVKNAPEDFYYWTPRGVDAKTTYVTYRTNKDYQIVSESAPYAGQFFHKFGDGSGNAYLTFMGGDQHLVKVVTGVPGSRKLLIVKDSYGNPIPSFLFYSFSEIHVVDFRYFKKNLKDYVAANHITDLTVAFNIFSASSASATGKVRAFMSQHGGVTAPPAKAAEKKSDSTAEKKTEKKAEPKAEPKSEKKPQKPAEPAPSAEPVPAPEPAPAPAPAPAEPATAE
ncbi:MAG: DHHW family protein [Muribaculaceae bacterium]|nr:DHHW family protein [Muribaculaceae bacterium]